MDINVLFEKIKDYSKKVIQKLTSIKNQHISLKDLKDLILSIPAKVKLAVKNQATRKHSLITWLSLCFASSSLIILLVLIAFQTLFFGSFYKAIKTKNLTESSQSIVNNIDHEYIINLMYTISVQNNVDLILCSHDVYANYQKGYTSIVNDTCTISLFGTKELNDYFVLARNNGGSYITVIDDPAINITNVPSHSSEFVGKIPSFEKEKAERLILASSFTDNMGTEYLLLMESIVTPPLNIEQTLVYQLKIILVILTIISAVMTIIFSKMIAKPIENINESAKELALGNYDIVFNGSGYREVEQLSDTLNYATTELQQVDQMRKDLIANVSHDLRTPLTLITGYGEVMRDIPGENTPENIQIIIDEATRLTSLVNDLIDISKIEAGTMKLEAALFCITDTVQDMFGRYNKLKEQDGFSFTFEHDQKVYVYADQLKISQVIYNLVNNAVNYAGESKEITVRQICYDNRVRIEVIDNGPGIPQDKLKNIWDRYYKVDKSHKSAKIGTGLGLSIVKTVLKLHKAQFGVFSKVGKGTVFWFELPRTDENGEPITS